jgi:hypothetical protein
MDKSLHKQRLVARKREGCRRARDDVIATTVWNDTLVDELTVQRATTCKKIR